VTWADAQPSLLLGESGQASRADHASPETAERIDEAVHRLLQGALDRALAILRENRTVLDRSANALLERETLDEAELRVLAAELRMPLATPPLLQVA